MEMGVCISMKWLDIHLRKTNNPRRWKKLQGKKHLEKEKFEIEIKIPSRNFTNTVLFPSKVKAESF